MYLVRTVCLPTFPIVRDIKLSCKIRSDFGRRLFSRGSNILERRMRLEVENACITLTNTKPTS